MVNFDRGLTHTYTHIRTLAFLWGPYFQTLVARTPFSTAVIQMILGHLLADFFSLLKHLVEIRKRPIFFVGTLLWGQFTLRTLPTCGDCGLDSTYGHTELHTRLVGIASWDSTYGYTWQNTLLMGTSWTVRIGTRQYTQLVLVGQSFAQLDRPIW